MSASVVDLAEARRLREVVNKYVAGIGGNIGELAITWAERADLVSGPLMVADVEMARAINRWGLRRAKADVRRFVRRVVPNIKDLPGVLQRVEEIYRGRLIVLEDERVAARGGAA